MPKLFYCNTTYDTQPPTDINPLILRRYKEARVLALCAREQMVIRIANIVTDPNYEYTNQELLAYGWWDAEKMGLISPSKILNYKELIRFDVVIIVSRDRIDSRFWPLVETVERFLTCPSLTPIV